MTAFLINIVHFTIHWHGLLGMSRINYRDLNFQHLSAIIIDVSYDQLQRTATDTEMHYCFLSDAIKTSL